MVTKERVKQAEKQVYGELRLPPQALEAEECVLGSILIDGGAIDRVISILKPGSFYKEINNVIYDAMLEMQNIGTPIDILTLTDHLKTRGILEDSEKAFYVTGLLESVPSAANVGYYAQIVRIRWVRRQIIQTGNEMIEDAYAGVKEIEELLDEAEHNLFELQKSSDSDKASSIDIILHDSLDKLDKLHSSDREHKYTGIPSGFSDLDHMTNGFQKSDLVIVAGRPSMGKTSFAMNVAQNAAQMYNYKVGIFSMEMSNYQLGLRLLTSEAQINSHKMRQGTLSKTDWPKLSKAAGVLSEMPLYIDDTAGLDILGLRSRIRKMKSENEIDMVVIDYLQLISGRGRMDNRQQEMSDISRSLKGLARELDITVMALSQLSRATEQRPGKEKRPIMSDLRESGAIEQDADVILFLYRPIMYTRNPDDEGKAELIIGKQRNGPTGTVHLTFRSEYTKFENAVFSPDEEYMVSGQLSDNDPF